MLATYEVTKLHSKGVCAGLTTTHTQQSDVRFAPKEGTVVKRAIGGGSYTIVKVVRIK